MQTEYSYGSFGESTSTGATSNNSTQYGGGSNDGTGLQFNGDSYYSPELKRFINEGSGGDNSYSIPGNGPTKASPSGPSSFLKNPFPSDYVLGNGISNTLNDLVMGDHFAEWAFILGDHCRPGSDRMWAGMKILGMGDLMAGGGLIVRGLMRGAGGLIKAGKKLLGGGKAAPVVPDSVGAATKAAGSDWAELAGMLQQTRRGKGNFGIGNATTEQAEAVGRSWVGDGAIVASDGKTLVSLDGLRQYRPPSFKPDLGITQANLEWRLEGLTQWQGNAHITIVP